MLSVMRCPCPALTRVSISQDTILYRSIYMYLLNHTDIRTVHRSLFERRNCLAIFSVAYVSTFAVCSPSAR